MKSTIYSNKEVIGTADLWVGDDGMDNIYGQFLPNENYYMQVRKSVWEFNKIPAPDNTKWASLMLNVQLENGYFLFASNGITIEDLHEVESETISIHIAGIDNHVIEDYFLQDPPVAFVEEPWEPLSIGQKIAFESELKKELGIYSATEIEASPEEQHILSDFKVSALCTDQRNDDVLFVTRKTGFDQHFAVVHLSWKGSKETQFYPGTTFFKDFDEFKYLKMFWDKIEWED
ncbi:hypothetical protein [Pedobacter sp. FW305-3-2-15-E-R2A2]|uniref:hypothetical protein n=1 Tax=Pedobacter sp. FW305-3-2-15-E-R2A2 TaxID=3140251 RepID=UPI003140254F